MGVRTSGCGEGLARGRVSIGSPVTMDLHILQTRAGVNARGNLQTPTGSNIWKMRMRISAGTRRMGAKRALARRT